MRMRVTLLALTFGFAAAGCDDDADNPPPAIATPASTALVTIVPSATSTMVPTQTAVIAPTTTATEAPVPTSTPTEVPSATAVSTATLSSTSTASPTSTPTDSPPATLTATATPTATVTASPAATASPTPEVLQAFGSVEQVYLINAAPAESFELRDAQEQVLATGTADAAGSLIFRGVAPGEQYSVLGDNGGEPIGAITVLGPDQHPDPSFYAAQEIQQGYGYMRTRDGTLLAINVLMPGPPENGPYPTVVEYSGYDPANPTLPQPSTLMASTLGYAAVGINMRGTGCSGGAFDFFEPLQVLDGYDAIETIAAQSWVKGNTVGMVGISYPGISQLFVAQTRPPSLAAIAPLSVISDIGRGILYPGGILNNGFAVEWADERRREAQPGGQPWSQARIDAGDEICIANQKLRAQTPDIIQKINDNEFRIPSVADPLSPITFVDRIDVPVFLTGAWQDEQTGGYFPVMFDQFTSSPSVHFSITNGGHIEAVDPENFARWIEFLGLYVAKEIPRRPSTANLVLNVAASGIFGVQGLRLPPDRFATVTTYDEARAIFEADPKVRVLFENGGAAVAGSPVPTFIAEFDAWPIPETVPTTWYFGDEETLVTDSPANDAVDTYVYDTSRAQQVTLEGGLADVWRALPAWDWPAPGDGRALGYATPPLAETLTMVGSGSVDLWFESTVPDVDVQVTLSEIRADGQEVYVQNGWLRASRRKLDESVSTALRPVSTHLAEDAASLPVGEPALMRVEIFPFAHVFRIGSRIRLNVEAPGATRPRWRFRALEYEEEVVNTVHRSPAYPSKVVLPVIPGVEVPEAYPKCPGLRGQPCRAAADWTNTAQ